MKNLTKNLSIIAVIVLLIALVISGCQRPEKPNPNNNYNNNMNYGPDENDMNGNDMNDNDNMNNRLNMRAERIANKIVDLDNVEDAAVVITDNTAIVGVDMSDNVEGDMTNSLKTKIEGVVRKTDKKIDNVTVTADPDLLTRIRNVGNDIKKGEPLSGLGREIEDIIKKMTP